MINPFITLPDKLTVLKEARNLIEHVGWTQWVPCKVDNEIVSPTTKEQPTCFCAAGAIGRALYIHGVKGDFANAEATQDMLPLLHEAALEFGGNWREALNEEGGQCAAILLNDNEHTTKQDVLNLFDAAIKRMDPQLTEQIPAVFLNSY